MNAIARSFLTEFGRIFANRAAFSVLILGVAIYSVLYPQPYLNQTLRDVPIAVVDLDGTQTSRDLARHIDATPDVAVVEDQPDIVSAEREVFARRIDGILVIPQYFERDLLHGRPSPVALYGDGSYLLIYQRVAGGVTAAARALGVEVEAGRLIALGVDPALATAAVDPMPLTSIPLFNPEGGYATYILPAAFVLILQQTLLIGTGLLASLPGADHHRKDADSAPPGRAARIIGKLLAYLLLEAFILPFYLIVLPWLYGVPRLGEIWPTLVLAVPFVFSVAGLGMVLAAIFRNPLAVQLATASVGLPFFMLAGFSWPAEAIPPAVRLVAYLLPSTSAIDGFTRIGQLGAPFSSVSTNLLVLWGLALFYNLVAFFCMAPARKPAVPADETVNA